MTDDYPREHSLVEQQQLIDGLLESHTGRSSDEIVDLLRRGLSRLGQPPAPDPWLHTVAGMISAGRRYVVADGLASPGDAPAQPDNDDEGCPAGGQHDLDGDGDPA